MKGKNVTLHNLSLFDLRKHVTALILIVSFEKTCQKLGLRASPRVPNTSKQMKALGLRPRAFIMADCPYVLYSANVATNVRNESQEEGKSDRVDKVQQAKQHRESQKAEREVRKAEYRERGTTSTCSERCERAPPLPKDHGRDAEQRDRPRDDRPREERDDRSRRHRDDECRRYRRSDREERGDVKWMICVKEVEMITTTIASIPEETLHVTALQDVIPTTMMMMGTLGGLL